MTHICVLAAGLSIWAESPLFSVAAFVLLAAVAGALGIAANLARLRLHGPLLVAISAGAGRWMIAVPVGPSGHYYPVAL